MANAFLEYLNGDHIGELIEIDHKVVSLGRMQSCDIVTDSKFTSVSQIHSVLKKTSKGWSITDVGTYGKGSTYGTYVNGVRLEPNKETIIQPGSEIRLGTKIGKYFRFYDQGTVPVPQPSGLCDRLKIDLGRRQVLLDGRAVSLSLTPQEFDFLLILWQKPGTICLFKDISAHLWPEEKMISMSTIDADLRVRINTLAHGLRRKLKYTLDGIDILESCRGVGYRIRF